MKRKINVNYINERKLSKLITKNDRNILRIFDEEFHYCNGYIFAVCNYDHNDVISKLIKVGAIKDIKTFTPKESIDLKKMIEIDVPEYKAEMTSYYKELYVTGFARIFKINEKYYAFDQRCLDIFEHVEYRAAINSYNLFNLRLYGADNKLVGIILPIRDESLGFINLDIKGECDGK
ncbi:hypothetical protein [Clostridium intestinale]|uniref:Uncharacterized protein n=1 Tax=Clostridium intestinale TaxID=36845 RepID=A0A7D6VM03_9CLOT|nr:hypothetical protein [Clostridium intestinale]QLY77827.1 hypothetical protein HZF06_11965 [Clostridium intestinale]